MPETPARQLQIQSKGSIFFVRLAVVMCVFDIITSVGIAGHLLTAINVEGDIIQVFVRIQIQELQHPACQTTLPQVTLQSPSASRVVQSSPTSSMYFAHPRTVTDLKGHCMQQQTNGIEPHTGNESYP